MHVLLAGVLDWNTKLLHSNTHWATFLEILLLCSVGEDRHLQRSHRIAEHPAELGTADGERKGSMDAVVPNQKQKKRDCGEKLHGRCGSVTATATTLERPRKMIFLIIAFPNTSVRSPLARI